MNRKIYSNLLRLFVAAVLCLVQQNVWAITEVNVETAGTLSTLLTSTDKELKVTGVINGTDIKYIRGLVVAGTVTSLDWSGVRIVSGGEAYTGSFKTSDDVIGEQMFYECSKLQAMVLPSTITAIQTNAFSRTGIKQIDIPNSVTTLGGDAFAYNDALVSVVIGKKVRNLNQGVFYSCNNLKTAYVKPLTPPGVPAYLFSSSGLRIYVYSEVLADYKATGWKSLGTLYGGLENTHPQEMDPNDIIRTLCGNFFEDAACTVLKADYQAMSDEELTAAFNEAGMPEYMVNIALKVKNESWAAYEKGFRIHSYGAYSDANYWNDKMMASGGSYMGNPTGIYAEKDGDEIYVFVDEDVPSDATLYFAGCVDNQLITDAKTGTRLVKGLNVIEGTKNALYYIVYTADTKSMEKTLAEWPALKIHVEGGKVNGYYDVNLHASTDYVKIRNASKLGRFTVRGAHSLFHLKTTSYRQVFSTSTKMDKSICWFDSVAVWEKNLMGMTEEVATGKKAGYPWYLTGGEAIYPLYYNNPNFAIEGEPEDAGYANSTAYRTSYNGLDCIRNCLDATNKNMDDWCAGHECGHNNQRAINVEGCTEASNNVFSNLVRYLGGLNSSGGSTLSTVMEEYARHEPFYYRDVNSRLRMYWDLYLYYHLGQKNTSFYPELFKALRKDPLVLYNTNNNNNGGLKFVRKVCEVAQEDLTDFFTIWGFFEPIKKTTLEDYGIHPIAVTSSGIKTTKTNISNYPVKNREIIFVEDRADYVLSTGFLQAAGKKRNGSDQVGQCGELGQFTSYWPDGCEPSSYVYYRSDSLYAMEGTGGLGFFMLDADNNIMYASNAKNFCIPSSVGYGFTIYSYDADGTLHKVTKAGNGTEYVELASAGTLKTELKNNQVIKLIVSGPINSLDINYMKQLVNKENLQSIDLEQAKATSIAANAFQNYKKLVAIKLPASLTSIGSAAFSGSGIRSVIIPDNVTFVGGDAFAYCSGLVSVVIGAKVNTMEQGVFYSSNVKEAYVKPLTPPTLNGVSDYLFSGKNRIIHVYPSAVAAYKAANWERFGTIVGDLTEDMIDGIEAVQEEALTQKGSVEGAVVFDLMGRKVSDLKPGTIYIRNGKKFMFSK
jgi:hypothetical protein